MDLVLALLVFDVLHVPLRKVNLRYFKLGNFPTAVEFGHVSRTIIIKNCKMNEYVWSCFSFLRNVCLIKKSADLQAEGPGTWLVVFSHLISL